MQTRVPRTYSREALERMSHSEKLQYLTELLESLERERRRASAPPPRHSNPQAAD